MKKITRFTLAALVAAPAVFGASVLPTASVFAAVPQQTAAKASALLNTNGSAAHEETAAEYAQFLQAKYNIQLPQQVKRGDFLRALAAIVPAANTTAAAAKIPTFTDLKRGDAAYDAAVTLSQQGIVAEQTIHADAPLTVYAAVFAAVKAAGFKELAYTYPQTKITAAFAKVGIAANRVQGQAAQELAAAIDTGLVPSKLYPSLRKGGTIDRNTANILLGKTLTSLGKYKNELGRTSDSDIYEKLYAAYRTADLIQAPELRTIVDQALRSNLVTGYNLKDSRYNSNFIDSLTITYGHDDIKHAVQLIGLLRSEGIDADVQFQPKTSAFIYLKEWGTPKETADYKVTQIENGNYIAYAKEYDIQFEFNDAADKERFNQIIATYAKKNSDTKTPLIYGSWWQPLYYSPTELSGYPVISNTKITLGNQYAQSFSLPSQASAIRDGFRKLAPDDTITGYDFWVDQPFFNYLNGESE
ncbi:hypothetical protein [Paenibacillus campi]|uniref:hypothetical protein n=1 Tax=Paenibacillus campi TaxID=3106031 RepID=UPI002AFEDCB7|nr:hypothetical protein [Paenibacillus sp. SGZ-1009]